MTTITVQPSHAAPAQQVHGLSMHPKVRAILEKGLAHEWTTKDVSDLLGFSERSARHLFESPMLRITRYPAKSENGTTRCCTGLSLLLYLLEHSEEITEADAQPILKKVLPLLTDQILEGVIGACRAIIAKRGGMLVVVKAEDKGTGRLGDGETARAKPRPKNVIGMTDHNEFSFVQELTPAASA
jgi:hypothetical protein